MKTLVKKVFLCTVMVLVLCGNVYGQLKKNMEDKTWWGAVAGFSMHIKTVDDCKTTTYYLHAIELGPRFGKSPVFISAGLGADFTHINLPAGGDKDYINTLNLHVPLQLGVVLGNVNKCHVSLRAGGVYNCLLQKFNAASEERLKFEDRSSWYGTGRITAGYEIYNLFVQYDIPLDTDDHDGLWRFGIIFGL